MARDHATAPARQGGPESVRVLLPLPLPAYDYAVPGPLAGRLGPGSIVRVPLGGRQATGVVWGEAGGDIAPARLREIAALCDIAPLKADFRAFLSRVADYTVRREGEALRLALHARGALEPPRPLRAWRLAGPPPARLTPARERVLALMADGLARPAGEIAALAGVSAAVARGLAAAGSLEEVALAPPPAFRPPCPERPGPRLSGEQRAAAEALVGAVAADAFAVLLLEGVPGSGKTEVYFEAVAAALRRGRQVLVLLPEIALGAQFLSRFEARFGAPPAAWHSDLSPRERARVWRGVATGEVRAVAGARSALFLPFRELGLMVVDEEHDGSYKQDDGVCYHARDMAVLRASLEGVPAVLSSATPSLETLANVDRGRYRRLHLPSRHARAALPEIAAVDMTRHGPGRGSWLSPPLLRVLAATLAAGEQALLYLNRRGYAPLTLCRACGHRLACPDCTAWLVEHRRLGALQCHHCGTRVPAPETCPACGVPGRLAACGPGVERLAEEVAARFPAARCEIMASDTLAGPAAMAALVARMAGREIDILIGTQIAAKGHHFPLLTAVGVVDADLGLEGGDPRAMERTWQLLHQVAGRAGREQRPGRVLLQTYDARHPVMRALVSGDREGFLAREKHSRCRAGLPPYGRLAAVVVSGSDAGRTRRLAQALARNAPQGEGIATFGPAPAPLAMLRGRHRWRLLVKASRRVPLQEALRSWLATAKPKGDLRLRVDVDPLTFL